VPALFTIGYEGATLRDFVATLKAAGVGMVIDVRERAQSRRPGFSKSPLSEALKANQIEYEHIRQLGDPKHGRDAARRGDFNEFQQIYGAHLELTDSQRALDDVRILAEEKPCVLLCYERDYRYCHRLMIVDKLRDNNQCKIVHLGVRTELELRRAGRSTIEGNLGAF
jgi:uncharacterized protein (DUF488 family)